ncbi:MAG: carbohydrate ABC transporter permease [Sphaerochaeta sp.]|jgi:multiple sugar transport system permease protein|nr:carbohydrate ABC transporter permease [Sphaerochaeta sp.]NBK23016.1 carbohydrate ABC transporter permease [Spirochaetia bacterium]
MVTYASKKSRILHTTAYYVAVYLILFAVIFPFLWMVLSSFKMQSQMLNLKYLFKFDATSKNYRDLFSNYNFFRPILNSFIIALISTGLSLVLALPASYGIARFGMKKTSLLLLVVRMIPAITFLVPWFVIFTFIGIVDTHFGLILAHMVVALPFIIWIMVPFFESLPKELEESAAVDGSTRFNSFLKIILPISGPGIVTSAILSFVFSWNNFMFGIILSGRNTKTLPVAIYGFISYTDINWGGLMAGSVVVTIPVIVISLFLQKYIIKGLTAGAVKG